MLGFYGIQIAGLFPRDQQLVQVLSGGQQADIQLLLMHGDADQVVPLERSGGLKVIFPGLDV